MAVLKQVHVIEEFAHDGLLACSGRILGGAVNLEKVTRLLRTCVVDVFEIQAQYYASLPNRSPAWIDEIARNTIRINIESASNLHPYSGLDKEATARKLRQTLRDRVSTYKAKLLQPIPITPMPREAARLPGVIVSPPAARRMEKYLSAKNIGQTEFATRIGVTDRTLRAFRRSGRVRRDIFEAIAKGMGISKEDLLNP